MSLDNVNIVDAVGIVEAVGAEKGANTVVLSLMDSWDWEDQHKHLSALQEKLNAYFGFVESGQIYDTYPEATGKHLRIDIVSRYPMPEAGYDFLAKASAVASELKMTISHRVH